MEPQNKLTYIVNLQQRKEEYTVGKDSLVYKWCWEN